MYFFFLMIDKLRLYCEFLLFHMYYVYYLLFSIHEFNYIYINTDVSFVTLFLLGVY